MAEAMLSAALGATRCHDVWPLLEAWAAAWRENEAAEAAWRPVLLRSTPDDIAAEVEACGKRERAARLNLKAATVALLAAVPDQKEEP